MNYLIDSCVWIDFFRHKKHFEVISELLMDNTAYINKIILAELIPSARKNKENSFIECLSGISIVSLNIDWDEIMEIQYQCLVSGINKLGLLDIAIAQNAKQNDVEIFSTDTHMKLLTQLMGIKCKII
ncbi:MAG: PIN domain-containing protein [Treponema sp.]|jgi:predicted nucleic acid-binding protein|nr:PIN domain-containing protein [Treponema sp.]